MKEIQFGSAKQENVVFSDSTTGMITALNSGDDPTRSVQDTHDATLDDFFKRPVKIASFTWDHGSSYFNTFNPWQMYFENPRVINRLTNFNLMRAKLHVKFHINGSGFAMGRMLASYFPLYSISDIGLPYSAIESAVLESQRPHIFLNPTTSEGGSLELPFFWFRNNLSIPDSEWRDMGQITLRSLTALDNANASTTPVTISVVAWAEDVELSALTTLDPTTLVAQSNMTREDDIANRDGFISGPASTLAKVANSMSLIPAVKPFALATEMIMSTTANIARLFGYSRPNITKAPEPYRPTPIGGLACCNTPEAVSKLTVDEKQELTVDPRISGILEKDPLSLSTIATREAFWQQFSWASTTASETLLCNFVVSPRVWRTAADSGKYFPACAAASLPFNTWTGKMKYRFQIMSSTFHKGRLKITYDPNYSSSEEMNVAYSRIVDIQEETDFTVTVGNGQTMTFLDMHDPSFTTDGEIFSGTRFVSKPTAGNGVLSVSVVNNLTKPHPTAGNSVWINVYVSAGEDIEFAQPSQLVGEYVLRPQSNMKQMDTDAFGNDQDAMETPNESTLMQDQDDRGDTMKVFYGERVVSLRTLMRRYNLHSSVGVLTGLDRVISIIRGHFPYFRGNVLGAVHATALAAPYNYGNTVMLHYVTWMFAGYRGSIRYKLLPLGDEDSNHAMKLYVERMDENIFNDRHDISVAQLPSLTTQSQANWSVTWRADPVAAPPMGLLGTAYAHSQVNPHLEFEVPYYSNRRFLPSRLEDRTTAPADDDFCGQGYWVKAYTEGGNNTRLDFHVSAGEDFSVYFFLGLPPLYVEKTVPAPTV